MMLTLLMAVAVQVPAQDDLVHCRQRCVSLQRVTLMRSVNRMSIQHAGLSVSCCHGATCACFLLS